MTSFFLTKNIKIGYNKYEDYDKLMIIVIYLGNESNQNELLRFFELLFTSNLKPNEIVDTLQNEYGIETSETFLQEVNEMCNLSDRIEERALKKGISQGIAQGVAQGEFNQAYKNILTIMDSLNLNFEDALNALKLSDELQISCRKKYQEEFKC